MIVFIQHILRNKYACELYLTRVQVSFVFKKTLSKDISFKRITVSYGILMERSITKNAFRKIFL